MVSMNMIDWVCAGIGLAIGWSIYGFLVEVAKFIVNRVL